ncbi:MAG: porin, partial [Candidatus Binatia bacterium]|nr:porin [Candidatus Binatia bacterium]
MNELERMRWGRWPGLLLGLLIPVCGAGQSSAGEVDPSVQVQLDAMREMLEKQNQVIRRQSEVIERLEKRLDDNAIGAKPVAGPPPEAKPEPRPAVVSAEPKPSAPRQPKPFSPPVHEEDPIPVVSPDQPALIEARMDGDTAGMKDEEGFAGFEAGYENGLVVRTKDPETAKTPFEMRINARMQFRYTLFDRTKDEWVDGTGRIRPIQNRSDFEIERARLTFSGYALSPQLQYFINLDGDTDDNHRIVLHDMWFNYEFNRYANLHIGKAMIPGSRDWLNGSTRTRFVDRSLTTTFFRPDRSVGIFTTGEPVDNLYYEVMIANGIATSDLDFGEVDKNFAYSGTVFWDPWGNYGKGYTDLEWHEDIAAL